MGSHVMSAVTTKCDLLAVTMLDKNLTEDMKNVGLTDRAATHIEKLEIQGI